MKLDSKTGKLTLEKKELGLFEKVEAIFRLANPHVDTEFLICDYSLDDFAEFMHAIASHLTPEKPEEKPDADTAH